MRSDATDRKNPSLLLLPSAVRRFSPSKLYEFRFFLPLPSFFSSRSPNEDDERMKRRGDGSFLN